MSGNAVERMWNFPSFSLAVGMAAVQQWHRNGTTEAQSWYFIETSKLVEQGGMVEVK